MAKIDDLTRQIKDARLRRDIEAAVAELRKRTRFGLVFESHLPEMTALPGLPIKVGASVVRQDKLSASHAFKVWAIEDGIATLEPIAGGQVQCAPVSDLIALQRFGEPIYPGLVSTGKVARGGDKPWHTVINGENYHVLKTLTWTHRGKVDAIYIDPPYNTGAKDWKYNNDYVEGDDLYRHSKWLAMMERRLLVAKELLNPADSVLIVTIDEKEYLRLGLLLEQTYPEARIQMVSSVINPKGTARTTYFSRTDEYIFVVFFGAAVVPDRSGDGNEREVRWRYLRRTDVEFARGTKKGGPAQFYPIYVNDEHCQIQAVGEPLPHGVSRATAQSVLGCTAVFPIRDEDGMEMNWGLTGPSLKKALQAGYVRVSKNGGSDHQPYVFSYLTHPNINKIHTGKLVKRGKRPDGSWVVVDPTGKSGRPTTTWREPSHEAGAYGTSLLREFLPGRKFPFPKSLYAVEDVLRPFVADKPGAIVLDYFAGSGTTAHAVMRLNKQDGGRRQCISITNNEVGADEQKSLREKGLRPGDPEWEQWGICDYITKPRIEAAITGKTPDGQPIQGDYKFTDEFPMAEGFAENAEFFTLTYLNPDRVDMGQQFAAIAPLLWLESGCIGEWDADDSARLKAGFSMPPGGRYAVLFRESKFKVFRDALADRPDVTHVYPVTNSEDAYTQMRAGLPSHVVTRRLYRDYLRSFRLKDAIGSENGK